MARYAVIAVILSMNANISWAQRCDSTQAETSPSSHFKIDKASTVTDLQSGRTWKRCSEGQQWQGHTCHGTPLELTADEALIYVQKLDAAQSETWRLPTHDELLTLVEARCQAPSINLQLFPATPATIYWTASNVGASGYWSVDFNSGDDTMVDHSQTHLFRLVH